MITIALAYSSDDQSIAQRIAGDLSGTVNFQHFVAGRANEGPVLADQLAGYDGQTVVLVSDHFLTNTNCMLRAERLFGGSARSLPVISPAHSYDEATEEIRTVHTTLRTQADMMHYISHWQDRYITLRRDAVSLREQGGAAFEAYYKKIRETSTDVGDVLAAIQGSWNLSLEQFSANQYQQLFIFAEATDQWHRFAGEPSVDPPPVPETEPAVETENPAPAAPPPPEAEEAFDYDTLLDQLDEEPDEEATLPGDQAATWIQRAWALSDAGDTEAALELLTSGRQALPDQHGLQYHNALMLAAERQDAAGARRELDDLLAKNPDHNDALFLSGELFEAEGKYEKAREEWEQLSDVKPYYPTLNYRLGSLLRQHFPTDYLDAAAYLRRATKSRDNAEAFYEYALILAGPVDRKKKAVKMLKRATELESDHAYAHYQLAVLQHESGKIRAARNSFRIAAALEPAFDTATNRAAFFSEGVADENASENDVLAALKQNIAHLEQRLNERREEEAEVAPGPGAGKIVLISGATSGIGRATARRLAAEDYRLILNGRRRERLEELAQELFREHGTDTYLLELDVRERDEVGMAISELPGEWQHIDLLINNAGKAKGFDPIQEGNLDHWDEMIDVNLKGLLYLTRAVTPGMVERGSGMVINIASTAGKEVYPNGNVYCATKHAVDALTYAMRLDLVKHGIRVGQICPAHVEETEFARVRFDGDTERAKIYEDFQPLRSPDVAEALYFMISQPAHVNVMDMVIQGTQQASSTVVDRSGRGKFEEEE